MAINPYSPCPCGSGQKLKFCCGDLAGEIEKIYQMVQGDQPKAALRHVRQLLNKNPGQGTLLDLRASLELSLHEFDDAGETISKFLDKYPDSAAAFAQKAMHAAATESGSAAIGDLQNALELLDNEMPLRVLEAIGAVGQALLMEGDLIAARGHLLLYAGIAPEEDNRGLELLMRMNLQAGLPLIMRDFLGLKSCPTGVEWEEPYRLALEYSERGLWRKSADVLIATIKKFGRAPDLVYSLAVIQGWLGNTDAFVAGLHKYAQFEVPVDDAVEAEALAQLVEPKENPEIETVRFVYGISNEEALEEILGKDKRLENYPLDPSAGPNDDAPRPRSSHVLLDRDLPSTGIGIELDAIPQVMGFASVYGKRTDRDAQLELTADRGEGIGDVQQLVEDVFADALELPPEVEVIDKKSASAEALSWRWRLPDDTPVEHRRELLSQRRSNSILERWTSAPQTALQGKSPSEAAADQGLRIPLLASVLNIEQVVEDQSELPLIDRLRQKLELPAAEPIEPGRVDLQKLPLVRIARLNLAAVGAEELATLMERSVLMGANLATLMVATELVEREDLPEDFDLGNAYRRLIRLEPDPERTGHWIEKARAWSQARGETDAPWLVLELEQAISFGDGPRVQSVLNELRDNYMEDRGVAESVYSILYSAGLIDPNQSPAVPSSGLPQTAAATSGPSESGGIWTPGADSSSDSGQDSADKPAIWTP